MNIHEMRKIIASVGPVSEDFLVNGGKFLDDKLKIAIEGKPILISLVGQAIGRSLYEYHDIALNYGGIDEEKPRGMIGRVNPRKVGETDGIKWALFVYQIDSGD